MSSLGANFRSKEDIISSYIKDINFSGNFDLKRIENDLTSLLLERPAIKLDWHGENIINEVSGKETRIEKIKSVKIYYTGTDNDGKLLPKVLDFYL
jgi:hypothetical protein